MIAYAVSGFVPKSVLRPGERRRLALPVELPRPATIPTPPDQSSEDDVLLRTLRLLWKNISRNANGISRAIPGPSEESKRVLFHASAAHYGRLVYDRGCKFIH